MDGDAWSWVYPNGKRLETVLSYRGEYGKYIRTGGWKRFSKNPFPPKSRTTQCHTVLSNGFKVSDLITTLQSCDPEATVFIRGIAHNFPLTELKDDREAKTVLLFI